MRRCPRCGLDVSPALRVCGVCQAPLDLPTSGRSKLLDSLVGWFRRRSGSAKRTVLSPRYGELTAWRWTPDKAILWEGSVERPGRIVPLKIALWGDSAGPSAEQSAFLERSLNDLERLEALARDALGKAPDRDQWPEAARRAELALSGIQTVDEDGGTFFLCFTTAEDPDGEYCVDFCGDAVEGTSRLSASH